MLFGESNMPRRLVIPIIFVLLVFVEKFFIDTYLNNNVLIFGGVYETIYKSNPYISSDIMMRFIVNFSGHFLFIIPFLVPIFLLMFFKKIKLINFFSREKFILFIYLLVITLALISSYYITQSFFLKTLKFKSLILIIYRYKYFISYFIGL